MPDALKFEFKYNMARRYPHIRICPDPSEAVTWSQRERAHRLKPDRSLIWYVTQPDWYALLQPPPKGTQLNQEEQLKLVDVYMRQGELLKAAEKLLKIPDINPNLLLENAFKLRDWSMSMEALERLPLEERMQAWPEVWSKLAEGLGRLDEAAEHIRDANFTPEEWEVKYKSMGQYPPLWSFALESEPSDAVVGSTLSSLACRQAMLHDIDGALITTDYLPSNGRWTALESIIDCLSLAGAVEEAEALTLLLPEQFDNHDECPDASSEYECTVCEKHPERDAEYCENNCQASGHVYLGFANDHDEKPGWGKRVRLRALKEAIKAQDWERAWAGLYAFTPPSCKRSALEKSQERALTAMLPHAITQGRLSELEWLAARWLREEAAARWRVAVIRALLDVGQFGVVMKAIEPIQDPVMRLSLVAETLGALEAATFTLSEAQLTRLLESPAPAPEATPTPKTETQVEPFEHIKRLVRRGRISSARRALRKYRPDHNEDSAWFAWALRLDAWESLSLNLDESTDDLKELERIRDAIVRSKDWRRLEFISQGLARINCSFEKDKPLCLKGVEAALTALIALQTPYDLRGAARSARRIPGIRGAQAQRQMIDTLLKAGHLELAVWLAVRVKNPPQWQGLWRRFRYESDVDPFTMANWSAWYRTLLRQHRGLDRLAANVKMIGTGALLGTMARRDVIIAAFDQGRWVMGYKLLRELRDVGRIGFDPLALEALEAALPRAIQDGRLAELEALAERYLKETKEAWRAKVTQAIEESLTFKDGLTF
ncbi:hypothetical protein KKB55_00150 [Myxococcota bacterium]|nr:hypothetical protein [Myxococcota bacterium]